MQPFPNQTELLDMSIWSLGEHIKELTERHASLTEQQREELRMICKELEQVTSGD